MRTKILDRLYIGEMTDCQGVGEDWFVVHACRNPCYCNACGTPDPNGPDYLSKQVGQHLYLNIIDPPSAALFYRKTFDDFLLFAKRAQAGKKPFLIHSNQGHSRAPTLAILFLAKSLRKLPDTSFDDAVDAFEVIVGQPYVAAEGIQTWMREHWSEFKQEEEFVRPEPIKAKGESFLAQLWNLKQQTPDDELWEFFRSQPLLHFSMFSQIQGKSHKWFTPKPNQLQIDIAEAYNWCITNKVPPRLIVLKPRQVGCSTFCVALCYAHQRRFPSNALLMADINSRTEKIWALFSHIPQKDEFPWDSSITKANTEKVEISYSDGSMGLVEKGTALDANSGISGTRQIILFSEAGKYKRLNGHDARLLGSALNSVPSASENPYTLVIMESTAEGSDGAYYEHWQKAVTLEQRKQGLVGNGYIKVFAAWHEFAEHQLPNTPDNEQYFGEQLDERERRGVALYNWTPEQIAWRRMKIPNDCQNDPKTFDQEFPEDASSAFLSSGRPRFNIASLTAMELRAQSEHDKADVGILVRKQDGSVAFVKTAEDSWLWVAEHPKFGRSYNGSTDCCTGAQSEGSDFPDAHSVFVLREGYMENSKPVLVRVAAALDVPNGCRWDPEILAERVKLLCDYYGGCQFTVEVTGQGLAVVKEYQRKEIPLYERQKHESLYEGGTGLSVVGWDTNAKTRPILVSEIANYIRDLALDCTYLPAVQEMKTFLVDDRGKAQAKHGAHDDHVMSLALNLATIQLAQRYMPPVTTHETYSQKPAHAMGGLTGSAFT